jgi:septum site-determining protein MinD
MGESWGIVSLKGGVGKTSVVASLGAAIASFGKKTLLVDGNLSAPNLGLHLNVINPEITLQDVLGRKMNITDAICELEGMDFIPSSMLSGLELNPFQLRDKIRFLKSRYDHVLIDSSPSLNNETLAVMLASDALLVVTTPDYPTLSTTIKAIRVAKKRGALIAGLILNKVHNKNFELSIKEIERLAEVPVLAVIPHDINVLKALSKFTPSSLYKPGSDASVEYKKLAATLVGEKYKPFRFKEMFRLTPKIEEINRELYYESVFKN